MLNKDKAYFEVSYATRDSKIPDIETYIYIGKNIFSPRGTTDDYYFQTPHSYLTHGNFSEISNLSQRAEAQIMLMKADMVETLYSLDELLRMLSALGNRYPGSFGDIPSEWHAHDT
jgi:hypothetical protein